MEQMLWSDPTEEPGRRKSPRGASLVFGEDVTDTFFRLNPPLQLLIRSHECMQDGYRKSHSGKLITVFSASNYCGTVGNDGAYVLLRQDCKPTIVQFYAKPKVLARACHATTRHDMTCHVTSRHAMP